MKFTRKYKNSLWFKGWEKVSQANRTENHADIVILISAKTDFKTKLLCRDGKAHFMLININYNSKHPCTKH